MQEGWDPFSPQTPPPALWPTIRRELTNLELIPKWEVHTPYQASQLLRSVPERRAPKTSGFEKHQSPCPWYPRAMVIWKTPSRGFSHRLTQPRDQCRSSQSKGDHIIWEKRVIWLIIKCEPVRQRPTEILSRDRGASRQHFSAQSWQVPYTHTHTYPRFLICILK